MTGVTDGGWVGLARDVDRAIRIRLGNECEADETFEVLFRLRVVYWEGV